MIKIKLNKELDYEVYSDFHDFSVAGVDFAKAILDRHPEINIHNNIEYIDQYYINNHKLIDERKKLLENELIKKEPIFWSSVSEIFGNDYTEMSLTGYMSIFNCNPRYIESNTFQICYEKDLLDMVEVVFHESLHFVFFEYCKNELSEEFAKHGYNSGPLWELSEIFNVIVLNQDNFRKIIEREEFLFYPELEEKLSSVKNIWSQYIDTKIDLKSFIKASLDNII